MGYIFTYHLSLSGLQPAARRMQVASDYILTQIAPFFNSKRLFFIFSTIRNKMHVRICMLLPSFSLVFHRYYFNILFAGDFVNVRWKGLSSRFCG